MMGEIGAGGGTPDTHKTSHQNGGADEISVAGLSGALADAQTPAAHKTSHQDGGSDEISVAGLSGALADAQTPAAHKTTHQDGGSDELDLTGLTGAGGYVDRGDPAAYDWTTGDFTKDNVWRDLDCSAIVPVGAKGIHFNCKANTNIAGTSFDLRKNGNANALNITPFGFAVSGIDIYITGIVACDANRVVEYRVPNMTLTILSLVVKGWFI